MSLDDISASLTPVFRTTYSVAKPISIELFAGIGGMTLGLEQAGFANCLAIDKNPVALATHLHNFPDTPVLCADITKVTGVEVWRRAELGPKDEVWLLSGGSPCPGFSAGGKRDKNDPRNNLLFEFHRLASELRPRYVLIENVPPMLESKHYRELCDRMEELGYALSYSQVLDANEHGVAQKRKRAIVLFHKQGASPIAPPTPIPECDRLTVAGVLQGVPSTASMRSAGLLDLCMKGDEDGWGIPAGLVPYPAGYRLPDREKMFKVARSSPGYVRGFKPTAHAKRSVARYARTPQGKRERVSRRYRLAWDRPALTLRAGTDTDRGNHTALLPLHPSDNRVITVREALLIHGYPNDFNAHNKVVHAARGIGNSVCPPVARAIAQPIFFSYFTEEIEPDRKKAVTLLEKIKETIEPTTARDFRLLNLTPRGATEFFNLPAPLTLTRRAAQKETR